MSACEHMAGECCLCKGAVCINCVYECDDCGMYPLCEICEYKHVEEHMKEDEEL